MTLSFSFFSPISKTFYYVCQFKNNDHSSVAISGFRYKGILLNVYHALKGQQPERARSNARNRKLTQDDISTLSQPFFFFLTHGSKEMKELSSHSNIVIGCILLQEQLKQNAIDKVGLTDIYVFIAIEY